MSLKKKPASKRSAARSRSPHNDSGINSFREYASDEDIKRRHPLDAPVLLRPSKLWLGAAVPEGASVVVLVACGSFSPPTTFHLRMMEDARDRMLAEGYHVAGGFMSAVHAAYGKKTLAPMHHRLNMLGMACSDSDWLDMDPWECTREGWTRTIECLKRFHDEMQKLWPGSRVVLVCGADLVESFVRVRDDGTPSWIQDQVETILSRNGVVCLERKGTNLEEVLNAHEIFKRNRKNITIFRQDIDNNVSSTFVRRLLQQGRSIKYLVHEEILKYIQKHHLAALEAWQPQAS